MAQIAIANPMAGTGLGTPLQSAGAPTSYAAGPPVVAGTFAGVIAAGGLLIDTVNKFLYQNTGTQAQPTYTKVGVEV